MQSEDRVHRVGETYIDVPTDKEVLQGLHQKEHRILNAKIKNLAEKNKDLESRLRDVEYFIELERTRRMESNE